MFTSDDIVPVPNSKSHNITGGTLYAVKHKTLSSEKCFKMTSSVSSGEIFFDVVQVGDDFTMIAYVSEQYW